MWHVEHQNMVFLCLWGMFPYYVAGCFFRYLLYLAQQTMQGLLLVAVWESLGWCCPPPCIHRRSDCWSQASRRRTAARLIADELHAEFIYEHVEGAEAVAGTVMGL